MDNKHGHSVPSIWAYVGVFAALMVLTAVTVAAATVHLGAFNTPVALAIAGTKASLVMWIFMELRHAPALTRTVALTGIVFLTIMLILTFGDYFGRGLAVSPKSWLGHTR
jgi:cytochrome c oxidase subunit 4